jgi:hypothetical protein
MATRTVRTGVALGLLSFCRLAVCQTAPVPATAPQNPELALYHALFQEVTLSQTVVPGSDKPLPTGSIKALQGLGLTDQELDTLTEIARDFKSKVTPLDSAERPLVFEARLYTIESVEIPASLDKKLKDISRQRDEVTLDHIHQLKAALGDSLFRKADDWLRLPPEKKYPAGSFALPNAK